MDSNPLDYLSPAKAIELARRAHPAFKFAIAVLGLFAIVAVVAKWGISPATLIFGVVILVLLMVFFVVFAQAAALARSRLLSPALFLVWSALFLVIATGVGVFLSAFADWPLPLKTAIISTIPSKVSTPTLPPLPMPTATPTVPPLPTPTPLTKSPVARFASAGGHIVRLGDSRWYEYAANNADPTFSFKELFYDGDYVFLVDSSRLKDGDPANPLTLRIPVKGGMAQWSWSNPVAWINLYIVKPD